MNVTLSLDPKLVERARRVAAAMGTSLNGLVRDHLERVVGGAEPEATWVELEKLLDEQGGHSRGWRYDREELHERVGLP